VRLARGEGLECGGHLERTGAQQRDRIAQVQPQGGEHLVIARTPEVDARPGSAAARGQVPLERGLTVLVGELDVPLAARVLGGERAERLAQRGEVARR
jgi:hypothetical protein